MYILGDINPEIRQLKKMMTALNYPSIESDVFDERTQNAVYAFQNDYGLPVNGSLDKNTIAALNKYSMGKMPEAVPIPETVPIPKAAPIPETMPTQMTNPEPEMNTDTDTSPEADPPVRYEPRYEPAREYVPERRIEPVPEYIPERRIEPIPEYIPERRIEPIPEYIPERRVEPIPEYIPEYVPEAEPIPGYVPVPGVAPMPEVVPVATQRVIPEPQVIYIPLSNTEPIPNPAFMAPYISRAMHPAMNPENGVAQGMPTGAPLQTPASMQTTETGPMYNNMMPSTNEVPANSMSMPNYIPVPISEPTQRNTPVPTSTYPILREGSRGEDVVRLQQLLNNAGYNVGNADGIFGPATTNAVKAFQRDNGLTADGIVGPATWNALVNYKPPQPPTEQLPVLREGSRGDAVKALQEQLKSLGYNVGAVDGIFGPGTTAAVKLFQSDNGLTPDGVVGQRTWEALAKAQKPQPEPTPESLGVIKEGSTGNAVTILQEKLKLLGYFPGSITGSFGPETTNAVKTFQRANGLTADGIVGLNTWTVLFRLTAPTVPQPPTPVTYPTIRYGATGEAVTRLQRILSSLLYYDGPINGVFDFDTYVAVKKFQDANRLTPDGIVGKNTWYSLNSLYPPPVVC